MGIGVVVIVVVVVVVAVAAAAGVHVARTGTTVGSQTVTLGGRTAVVRFLVRVRGVPRSFLFGSVGRADCSGYGKPVQERPSLVLEAARSHEWLQWLHDWLLGLR